MDDWEEGEEVVEMDIDGEEEEDEDDMDILDCIVSDAFRVDENDSLSYEALAQKKREAAFLRQQGDVGPSRNISEDDIFGANFEDILEEMTGRRRKRRKRKKMAGTKGRKKGQKAKLDPAIARKIGDGNIHSACGNYSEAIKILKEVVQIEPRIPECHHTLALVYEAIGDKKKTMNCYIIAALVSPKDVALWKRLVALSIEQGFHGQARYCLKKAITADPEDVDLRLQLVKLHSDLGDHLNVAKSCHKIIELCPSNVEVCKMAAEMYRRCGQVERAIDILENYLSNFLSKNDLIIVSLLMSLHIENDSHVKALEIFELISSRISSKNEIPLYLKVKAGVCHAYLGNMKESEFILESLWKEPLKDNGSLVLEAANLFFKLGLYESALKYYFLLEGTSYDQAFLQLNISKCYLSLNEHKKAIPFYYKALSIMKNNVDVRISLSLILVQEERIDEAITLLSPPLDKESINNDISTNTKPWWLDGRIKLKLARIYYNNAMLEEFVDTIFASVCETLRMENMNGKISIKKRLTIPILSKRARLLDDPPGSVLCGVKPIGTSSELLKACRAKKMLPEREEKREERKVRALENGFELSNDDLEEESDPKNLPEKPLPKLLNDEEHYCLILDLCKALFHLQRYWDALEIINNVLYASTKTMSRDKKEELRTLRSQIAYRAIDPKHGYEFVRSIVMRHPNSLAAWNCYYEVISRLGFHHPKHAKFMQKCARDTQQSKCVPPMIIQGHQFTLNSTHQDAAKKYLHAYKLQPDNPLINLCCGTSLINLALGFRLKNKHLTLVQGMGFLFQYLRICNESQEALYNIARAFQHVGLVTLAVSYYEKVLEMEVDDYPIPKLLASNSQQPTVPGYCNLRREAAFNLHLIYMKSGSVDLARHILKTYCTI
ncbi:putative Transcription factor [Zostera marina]|uniref:Putative Transcription factor n=1 Tax=Zostera marina TaxID=29655 RepID=A0A0K9NVH5_ZOSMR|nr:putative Transcription factor [Zostera marina]